MKNMNLPLMLKHLHSLDQSGLAREIAQPEKFVLDRATKGAARFTEIWAPFDHVNPAAKLAIVGLTPGRQQMAAALMSCHAALRGGRSPAEALAAAKKHASFAGPMRTNLVALLDDLGVATEMGLESTASLWGATSNLVHFTSALRYPIFKDEKNWSGTPGPMTIPMLRNRIETTLAAELAELSPDCRIVPLGPVAAAACLHAAARAGVTSDRILNGLPHPSGANAERIAVFLGRKPAEKASRQTDPQRLLAARSRLLDQMRRTA